MANEAEKAAKLAAKEAEKAAKEDEEASTTASSPVHEPENPINDGVYDAETENEDSDGDDSDEEEAAGVEEFEHKGKKYLRDPATNDIFDYDVFMKTQEAEEIGVYDPTFDEIDFHE